MAESVSSAIQLSKCMKPGEVIIIVVLAILVGYLYCQAKKKKRDDIIKLLIKRELLPAPGNGQPWIQDGSCFMADGSTGIVKGNYCEQIRAL